VGVNDPTGFSSPLGQVIVGLALRSSESHRSVLRGADR
jgi:hypothetical protein